jgi:glucose-1-phosphate adenylyltransferase
VSSRVLSLILGGGRGTRLYPLTMLRSKPAVPIAGKYRLIDIPISNCLNSGFNRIFVLTQFLSVSLHRHIAHTFKFDPFGQGFVEILAAQQTNETADWYQGTADAVRQNLRYIQEDGAADILILSGDQLYRMDYRQLVATHQESQADATIAVIPVAQEAASGLGLLRLDDAGRVIGFVEKPKTEEHQAPVRISDEWYARRGLDVRNRPFLASMGIYLFRRDVLVDLLNEQRSATDFGKEIFPRSLRTHKVVAHLFDGYWEDVGTIKAYHEANLSLASNHPPFDFHTPEGVMYTRMRFLPASRVSAAQVEECLISDGCIVDAGARLIRCVVGVRSHIGRSVGMKDTVMVGSDQFETDAERRRNEQRGIPDYGVGEGTVIEKAILDKDCRIGKRVRIINKNGVSEDDSSNYVIREGIVVIPKGAIVPDDSVI